MRIYVGVNGNPEKQAVIRSNAARLGMMYNADDMRLNSGCRYALDNGAYSAHKNKTPFPKWRFLESLKRAHEAATKPDFVVIPDIVAGGLESLAFSLKWRQALPDSFSWYLAVQDGMKPEDIPAELLARIDGVFIGGSKTWKYRTGEAWVAFAHSHGKKAHIGRVGTVVRMRWAEIIGADSIDSTNFARNARDWPRLLKWLLGEYRITPLLEVAQG